MALSNFTQSDAIRSMQVVNVNPSESLLIRGLSSVMYNFMSSTIIPMFLAGIMISYERGYELTISTYRAIVSCAS